MRLTRALSWYRHSEHIPSTPGFQPPLDARQEDDEHRRCQMKTCRKRGGRMPVSENEQKRQEVGPNLAGEKLCKMVLRIALRQKKESKRSEKVASPEGVPLFSMHAKTIPTKKSNLKKGDIKTSE